MSVNFDSLSLISHSKLPPLSQGRKSMDHQLLIYVEDAMTHSSLFPGLVSYPFVLPFVSPAPALSFVQNYDPRQCKSFIGYPPYRNLLSY